jgi:ADP-heptose:LPS heptosyltransferase
MHGHRQRPVLLSAAIESLKRGHSGARLTVVAHHSRMAVHQHNPHADKVLPYSKSPFARLRLLGALRSLRPDLVVALRLNEDAVPLGYLANRRAFVGSQRRCKSFSFLLSLVVDPPRGIHSVDEMLFIARAAGIAPLAGPGLRDGRAMPPALPAGLHGKGSRDFVGVALEDRGVASLEQDARFRFGAAVTHEDPAARGECRFG